MSDSYGFLSTYPPTQCGLATFTAALLANITLPGSTDTAGVVQVVEGRQSGTGPEVVHRLRDGFAGSLTAAAAALNRFDVVIVQHEYGIFTGADGDDVLALLDRVRVPVIVVFHTVLEAPTPHQRQVLERVMDRADAVVVMTETARRRLLAGYRTGPAEIVVIPHGAPASAMSVPAAASTAPMLLTWGLLGPGKGIEWAVEALSHLRDLVPPPRYVVAGQTHPKVLERCGESYREELAARAHAHGVADLVEFVPGYLETRELRRLIRRADVVVLPYDSPEQVTSGVLIEAVAALKPVVSTRFPHAVELLGAGAGLLVPHGDAVALAAAVRRVLTEPGLAGRMATESARIAPSLGWPAVADRYRDLATSLLVSHAAVTL
ncbi:MAG: glycosyltransferase [Mycobacteriales bacterium]